MDPKDPNGDLEEFGGFKLPPIDLLRITESMPIDIKGPARERVRVELAEESAGTSNRMSHELPRPSPSADVHHMHPMPFSIDPFPSSRTLQELSFSFSTGPQSRFYISPDDPMPLPAPPMADSPPIIPDVRPAWTLSSALQHNDNSPDARVIVATAGYDRNIRLWDLTSGDNYRTITNRGHMNKVLVTLHKKFIVAAGNPHIHFYELNTLRNVPFATYFGHKDNVTCVDLDYTGNWMISCSEDKAVRFWDLRMDPRWSHEFLFADPLNSVKMHPNQAEVFCAGEEGVVRILDLRRSFDPGSSTFTTACLRTHPDLCPSPAIKSMDISRDGKFLAVANVKGVCYVWNLRQNESQGISECELFAEVQAHGTYITKCCFSPVSSPHNLLVTCSADKTMKLWKVEPTQVTRDKTLVGHQRWVWDCAFSSDGTKLLSSSSDSTAKLWQLSTGRTVRTYSANGGYAFNSCAFFDAEVPTELDHNPFA